MRVRKRDNTYQEFNRDKIEKAVQAAFKSLEQEDTDNIAAKAADKIENYLNDYNIETIDIEHIQDLVENTLMRSGKYEVAKAYITYRYQRKVIRDFNTTDEQIFELIRGDSDYWNNENSNKDARKVTTQRDYIAGITNTDIARRFIFPKEVIEAHDAGIIHLHDIDYAADYVRTNCCLANLNDMLQNGTVLNGVKIEKPKRFLTACTVATQIIMAISSSQYGGITVTLTHLAPFVRDSYNEYVKKYQDRGLSDEEVKKFAMEDTRREVKDGVQTFNYKINSMASANGQSPFSSVNMYLNETEEYKDELALIIEEFLNQRIQGMKNEQGVWVTMAFPKLLYVLEEDNIRPGSKYWYLTELAAKCTAKRLVPDYISEKIMKQLKINKFGTGDCYPCMGCRSFLTPDNIEGNPANALDYEPDKPKYYGRFNCGVCTVNLADIAFSSKGDYDAFWKIFQERTELCHLALRTRVKRIENAPSDVAPILWQHGGLARLEKGESIKPLIYGGYSTVSLGYAALYECVKYMTGHSHTEPEGREFGLKVMQALNDKCAQWKNEENIGYSLYGTPIESTTYKFAKCLKKRFGTDIFTELDGKDRNYITNSYHVPVFEEITPFDKLEKEAEFQKLSPGGAISYIETADLTHNIEAVEQVMQFIYDHIMYAELNTKSDYCQVCGYDGEIKIIDEGGKLHYQCPNCGNTDSHKMNVARRVCGYISTTIPNQGRLDEIAHRVVHLDTKECC